MSPAAGQCLVEIKHPLDIAGGAERIVHRRRDVGLVPFERLREIVPDVCVHVVVGQTRKRIRKIAARLRIRGQDDLCRALDLRMVVVLGLPVRPVRPAGKPAYRETVFAEEERRLHAASEHHVVVGVYEAVRQSGNAREIMLYRGRAKARQPFGRHEVAQSHERKASVGRVKPRRRTVVVVYEHENTTYPRRKSLKGTKRIPEVVVRNKAELRIGKGPVSQAIPPSNFIFLATPSLIRCIAPEIHNVYFFGHSNLLALRTRWWVARDASRRSIETLPCERAARGMTNGTAAARTGVVSPTSLLRCARKNLRVRPGCLATYSLALNSFLWSL